LHLVGFLLTLNYDARNHELKKKANSVCYAGHSTLCFVEVFAWTVGLAACGKIHAADCEYDHLTSSKWLSSFNFYLA